MSKGIKFFMAMVIMLIALPFGTNVVKADDGKGADDGFIEDITDGVEVYYESDLDVDT